MAAFEYRPTLNPYAASLGEILLHGNDAAAHAAEQIGQANARARMISGDVWGRAIAQAGQIPSQIAEDVRRTKVANADAALRDSQTRENNQQIDARTAAQTRAQKGMQLLGQLHQQYGDDYHAVADALLNAGYADEATKYRESGAATAEHKEAIFQAHAAAVGGAALRAKTADGFMLDLDQYVSAGMISQQERAGLVKSIEQAGPGGFDAWRAEKVDWADRIVKPKVVKEGDTILGGVSGKPLASAPKKPKTEAELAADAADPTSPTHEQSAAAMALLKPKPLPATPRQYEVTIPGLGGKPIKKLVSEAELQQGVPQYEKPPEPEKPAKPVDQNKLEQEYRTVLTRGLSSRSGGLGLEDAKVQQANHLLALLDQSYDPKTGSYNIPRVQQTELAMGLAKLVSPSGTVGVQMEQEINQRTAKGDFGGLLTYLTGTAFNGTTQDLVKMYRDSIKRQGEVAEQNREGEMRYLRGLAPTELEEPRRSALEKNSLNPLRQSRVIQNAKTGERRVQVSTDGGETWK